MFLLLAVTTLLAELALGYPKWLFAAIGHPVTWIGAMIAWLDRTLNSADRSDRARRAAGVLTLFAVVAVPALVAWLAVTAFGLAGRLAGLLLEAVVASSLIAQRSLAEHVGAVAKALEQQGLEGGRRAVSMIVGRDPDRLDEAGVCRAAIESLAENFSDGVVAPAVWLAVGGLPAAAAYKAVNTADSMIGHKTQKYRAFGWASARFDDLVNLPASRLSALLIVAAATIMPGASAAGAWRAVLRDARNHRSPNAGWPEAAMAGALGISIAGPRSYGGVLTEDSEMGQGNRRELTAADIRAALRLYWAADIMLIAAIGVGAAIVTLHG
jgi:adenosylcobinamide-phosphate synthase